MTLSTAATRDTSFAAFRHGPFRTYFATGFLSMMADNIEHVISYWVIFQAFHSPALAGFAVVSHWTPFLVLGVWFGGLADRYDCRRLIQISQAAFIAASVAWAVLFLTGTLEAWHAAVLLVVHGLAGALWSPAGQLIVQDIVGREALQSGVRLSATGRNIGILLGPAVGGALLLTLGPAYGLLVNALLYLPMTVWLLATPYTGHVRSSAATAASARLSLGDAWRTMREVSGDRGIVVMVALAGLSSLFVGNAYQAQMPEFAEAFGSAKDEITYSVLLTASAAGAVVGGLSFEAMAFFRQPRMRTAVALSLVWAGAIAAFALTPVYVVAVAALLLAGFLNIGFTSMAQAYVQLAAPPERRGRVVGLFSMSWNGLRVGSGITVGMLGAVLGIHSSLALSALGFFAAGLLLLAYANGRARERVTVTAPSSPRR